MIDALEFLERHKNWKFPYFGDTPWQHRIWWRAAGFFLWVERRVSLRDAVKNILPHPLKSRDVQKRIWAAVNARFMEDVGSENLLRDGIEVFGRPFHIANDRDDAEKWVSTFKMLNESIAADQYQSKKCLKPDSVVVDAGANIGAFSVLAAKLCPQGFIHSFEPNPPTFAILRVNLSSYRNAKPYQMALGEKEREANFVANLDTPAASALEDSGMPLDTYVNNALPQKVKVTTLDSLKLSRLDFLKLDAEGYEARIILGGKDTIRKFRPPIIMEVHHRGIDEREIPRLIRSIAPRYSCSVKTTTEKMMVVLPREKK